MAEIKSVCVYCGSSMGNDPAYREAAVAMGTLLAREGIKLVYGGGKVGLMGAVADAALAAGGKVHGIIPEALSGKEIAHAGLQELEVVDTMHLRKARMAEVSDAFIAMPGGLGTYEELFESWTWAQLGWHRKPVSILNVAGYYDHLLLFLRSAAQNGFVGRNHVDMCLVAERPEDLLMRLRDYDAPPTQKWVGRSDL